MTIFINVINDVLTAATDEEAIEYAINLSEWTTESMVEISHARYVDTADGIDIFYNYGADHYFFVVGDDDDHYSEPDELTEWMDFDPDC